MLGLDPKLMVQTLNVEPGTRPIAHPTRVFHTNVENQIIQEV